MAKHCEILTGTPQAQSIDVELREKILQVTAHGLGQWANKSSPTCVRVYGIRRSYERKQRSRCELII